MLCIVQARMSSRRLPGKVLMDLHGRPVLGRVLDRVRTARSIGEAVVATSDGRDDDAIEAFCEREGVRCFRGPLDNVADRYRLIVESEKADAFVRVTGDSPLIDPAIVNRAVELFRAGECDLATNVLVRTFPIGQSVEVLATARFAAACSTMTDAAHREHLTKAYYDAPGRYRIVGFTSGADFGTLNLSVDTRDDLERIERQLAALGGREAGWRELAERCYA